MESGLPRGRAASIYIHTRTRRDVSSRSRNGVAVIAETADRRSTGRCRGARGACSESYINCRATASIFPVRSSPAFVSHSILSRNLYTHTHTHLRYTLGATTLPRRRGTTTPRAKCRLFCACRRSCVNIPVSPYYIYYHFNAPTTYQRA